MPGESPPEISGLLNNPLVVATVHDEKGLAALRVPDLPSHADVLEFRLDSLRGNLDALPDAMAGIHALPMIATARHPGEGGAGNLSAEERLALLRRFAPGTAAVDIELRSLEIFGADVVAELKSESTLLIASFHDFEKTPPKEALLAKIEEGLALGADIVKLATHLETMNDLVILAEVLTESQNHLVSAMGMGELGKVSRLLLAKAGSVLNYGYLTTPNAPGQWPARELKRIIAEL